MPSSGPGPSATADAAVARSPSTNQPFIYPIRSAVSVKRPGHSHTKSQSESLSRSNSILSQSNDESTDASPSPVVDLRNTPSDVDPRADKVLADFKVPGTHGIEDLRDRLEAMTTRRFEHVKTEEGHMILVGREGALARCVDEPIHSPGAIQSFGCMIAVRVTQSGELIVRQVSENTGELLGLAPAYLFSLKSLLDILDEDQAELLWDNIDTLETSGQDCSEAGPSIFQLRGGNMAYYDEKVKGGEEAVTWCAWCAAHIPDRSKDPEGQFTVVLEFELVDDQINPISSSSPPPSPSLDEINLSSNASISGSPPPSVTTIDSEGTVSSTVHKQSGRRSGLEGKAFQPSASNIQESTQATHRPLKALSRLQRNTENREHRPRSRRPGGLPAGNAADGTGGMLDMFGVLSQVNEQLAAETDLSSFLKVLVGIIRDLTTFTRVMVYQFDEAWNGQVVCELVDWNDTHDLYRGLHFPATDIPAQARALYKVNKVRLLYDRDQATARLVCRDESELESPVDMTHSYLRAMSPIHLKYLGNMGVRSSMSISIVAFGELWGIIALHNYGARGKRVSFLIRQLSRLIGESVSRNIERLSYTHRLSARKLINTLPTDQNPSGYIISNAEDLLTLFDADFGVIAIGNEAKILGPLSASQEVLAVTEYLRLKKFEHLITSQDVRKDFPDMVLPTGLEVIAGLLLIPLSGSGIDFIAFLRKAQVRHVNWAGKPFKEGHEGTAELEPRKSFKVWSETVQGTCRAWKDEELETASVLCLVYGKFISVWKQREQALHYNQLNRLLLSNASHEVRTPLNHIINYLEMALDSRLDEDTRENLSKSHMASKSLLFVINDLLDLTKQEEGNKLFLQEPFDLAATVREAVEMHEWEAKRRKIDFTLVTDPVVCMVLGDKNRVRQVVTNTVTNSVKYTAEGHIYVSMKQLPKEERNAELPLGCDIEVELSVTDTGEGIPREKLEAIFREFEQVESVIAKPGHGGASTVESDSEDTLSPPHVSEQKPDSGLGLGLAIVARIVKNLGGQLRVDSSVGEGSTFTFYIPFCSAGEAPNNNASVAMRRSNSLSSGSASSAGKSEIDSLVEAIREPVLRDQGMIEDGTTPRRKSLESPIAASSQRVGSPGSSINRPGNFNRGNSFDGQHAVKGSGVPIRSVRIEPQSLDTDYRQAPGKVEPKRRKPVAEMFKEEVRDRDRQKDGRQAIKQRRDRAQSASGPTQKGLSAHNAPKPGGMPSVAQAVVSPGAETTASGGSNESVTTGGGSGSERRTFHNSARRRLQNARAMLNVSKPNSGTAEKLPPLRVLVVEDDPINRMILKKRLSMDGHTVLLAVNGEEGVRQFEKDVNEFDVILMDLQMPICNGQDACIRIRKLELERKASGQIADRPAAQILNGRVPIIAVSATLSKEMRQNMTDIGMDGWALKPIDFARLKSLMKGLHQPEHRLTDQWKPGYTWEKGGWLSSAAQRPIT